MKKKGKFIKYHFDYPMHKCFYCQEKPNGILSLLHTNEEVRVCEKCAINFVRRLKRKHKRLALANQAILNQDLHIKNASNDILEVIS